MKTPDTMTITSDDNKIGQGSLDSYSTEEVGEYGTVSLTEYGRKMMRRKIKIDISHSKAYDHLKNGTSETIDFTGHGKVSIVNSLELGDAGIAFLYDLLSENKKMTSLKLMKNKLTNDGASILFHVFYRLSQKSNRHFVETGLRPI